MNFVIPMAGRGQRFADAGYLKPKMLIEARGKTLLEWSIDSLPLELCTNMVCIILREHEQQHGLSAFIQKVYGGRFKIRFYYLDQVTRGQAETVFVAESLFEPDKDLVIFNIDTAFNSSTLVNALRQNHDGVLGSFYSTDPRFSYAQVDSEGIVTRTAEKEVISQHALTGLYHFRHIADFTETVLYHIENDLRVNNEFYIAPMYNYLISKGRKFITDDVAQHFILGTPAELQEFVNLPAL